VDQESLHTLQDKWNKRFTETGNKNEWLDTESKQVFGYNNRNEPYSGGWFNFNCGTKEWLESFALDFFNRYFGPRHRYDDYNNLILSPEILITANGEFQKFNNSSVLVIGGGPSSKEFDLEKVCEYDYVFTCNYFYKTPRFKDIKPDLMLLGHQVDLHDPKLKECVERYNPLIGFEHSDHRTIDPLNDFKNRGANVFLFLTRYFSRLGYTPRAIAIAALLGAKKIDYVGFDGFKDANMKTHAFEPKKAPPAYYDKSRFDQQTFIFWHYIQNLSLNAEYENIAEESEHNVYTGLRQNAKERK
tara:strand:- start:1425 stop:2327 length:903 start_codon:yes stop_codon:yes gene_type:complete